MNAVPDHKTAGEIPEKHDEILMENIKNSSNHYSDEGFWTKVFNSFHKKRISILETVLALYYSYKDDETPKWAKRVIVGALGYWIFPLDVLPDFLPGIGYSDDIATIFAAISVIALHIKSSHKTRAKEKIKSFTQKKK